jgi:phage/plasmid-associated DNA primase
MPPKKNNKKIETSLYEKFDINMIKKLISADGIDEIVRNKLKEYYHKINENGYVHVNYSCSDTDMGRLYAHGGLSLQSFKKYIRHALAKDIYIDIDIVNAHPVLIMQYCEKNDIPCEKLTYYVSHREVMLKEIQKKHKINRDQAKKLMLRLCYHGEYIIEVLDENEDPTGEEIIINAVNRLKRVVDFKNEIQNIAKDVCDIEKDVYAVILKDKTKSRKEASTLSIVTQIIENNCLMAMKEFFTNKHFNVGVLCFDGMMIEKNKSLMVESDLNIQLRECEKYIVQKTGYSIELSEKPMDHQIPDSIILPKYNKIVDNDLEAQEQLFRIEGAHKFKYCEEKLYVFNEKTGMYDTHIETLQHYIIKNKDYLRIKVGTKLLSYGENATMMNKITPFVKTAAVDDDWLFKTENTSLGYLLFEDGIYNMETGEFKKEFDPSIVFHIGIPHKFPLRCEKKMSEAKKKTFETIFGKPDAMIYSLARALAGDKYKKFYFCPGRANAGKSKLVSTLIACFGRYVGSFNAESLVQSNVNDTKDEAAKLRWSLLVRFSRILVSNEVNMKRPLDGNAIKKHSGGDQITGRTHGGEEFRFTPHYTIFCMLNDIPKIEPLDSAAIDRLEYIEFPFVFTSGVEKNIKPYHKTGNSNIDKEIIKQDFIDGFIHVLLDAYRDFKINGMPEFDQAVKHKWTVEGKQDSEITDLIKQYYIITNKEKDRVLISAFKKFKECNKDVFQTISPHRFNEILENDLGLKLDRDGSSRFWKGIRAKTAEDFEREEF